MSRIALRGGVSGFALATLLFAVPAAHAATQSFDVGSGIAIDATSDARYVLYADHVLDRQSGEVLTLPAGTTALDIADRAPRVLLRSGDKVVVRDLVAGTEQIANIWDHQTVAVTTARLVANGHRVILQADQPNHLGEQSIIESNLDTGVTGLRMAAANLLDASEDGRVITFSRATTPVSAPAGYIGGKNALGQIEGRWIGYVLDNSGEPRIVDRSSFTQTCQSGTDTLSFHRPTGLQISQDGTAQRYVLTESASVPAGQFQSRTVWSRSTPTGFADVFAPANPNDHPSFTVDPVSGASVKVTETGGPVTGFPTNVATLVDGAGNTAVLPGPIAADASAPASWIYVTRAIPTGGGAGALYSGSVTSQGTSAPRTLALAAQPVAQPDTKTTWSSLPRTGDPVVTSYAVTANVSVKPCAPSTPAGLEASGYATFAPQTTGNSAGSVTFNPTPAGYPAAKSLTSTISWGGLRLWSRTQTTAGDLTLPALPVGISGFKLTMSGKLADGTVLTGSAALRRTR